MERRLTSGNASASNSPLKILGSPDSLKTVVSHQGLQHLLAPCSLPTIHLHCFPSLGPTSRQLCCWYYQSLELPAFGLFYFGQPSALTALGFPGCLSGWHSRALILYSARICSTSSLFHALLLSLAFVRLTHPAWLEKNVQRHLPTEAKCIPSVALYVV